MKTLQGKTALVTCSGLYMGPAIASLFRDEGAEVHTSDGPFDTLFSDGPADGISVPDIVVANFAVPPRTAPASEMEVEDWDVLSRALVRPLVQLVRAVIPRMIERRSGKIIGITSAAPLQGIPRNSLYCAARAAQNSFLQTVGIEVARHNIQVNAIAQNFVENNVYYPEGLLSDAATRAKIESKIPARRLGRPDETASLALFLASEQSAFLAGQIIPLAGGWATGSG